MRPASWTSKGSVSALPPASFTVAAVSSALSTPIYVFHTAVGGAASGVDPIAATARPRSSAMKYPPGASAGTRSSSSQPKSSP